MSSFGFVSRRRRRVSLLRVSVTCMASLTILVILLRGLVVSLMSWLSRKLRT